MTQHTLSRRRLLGGGLAAGTAALAGTATAATRTTGAPSTLTADVCVVGAGLAGLVTARRLTAAGARVVVLEARDRVGGRTERHALDGGGWADLGGTWVGPTQDRVVALAGELGLRLFDQVDDGQTVSYLQGRRSTFSDSGPTGGAPDDPTLLPDLLAVVTLVDELSTTVPVDAPWEAPRAAEWDALTLDSWLRTHTANPEIRKVADGAFEAVFGADALELSFLYCLWYVACAGDEANPGTFERLIDVKGGAQAQRFVDGSQAMSLRMAADLGGAVHLAQPVRAVRQDATGVTVVADGVTVRARRAVVAVPPALAGRIAYDPLLPAVRDAYTQRSPQGRLAKVEVLYDTPWWRDAGLSGAFVTDSGPGGVGYDVTPFRGAPGGLLAFVGGRHLDAYGDDTDGATSRLGRDVVDQLVVLFGPQAAEPRDVVIKDWRREEWSRGCPVHVLPPGVLTQVRDALWRPVGRVHWAGTETATYWHGYMDGAVRSGERAAREVLAALG